MSPEYPVCTRERSGTAGSTVRFAGTVDLSTMKRVGASAGRCSHCDLAPAAWTGTGVRRCYERETRRRAEELAKAVDRFFVDLEAAGAELLKEEPCPTS